VNQHQRGNRTGSAGETFEPPDDPSHPWQEAHFGWWEKKKKATPKPSTSARMRGEIPQVCCLGAKPWAEQLEPIASHEQTEKTH